jgi:monoamine oxidase
MRSDRRDFLKLAAMGMVSAAATPLFSSERAADRSGEAARRVVVIGAGLAGLAAAFELQQSGFDVTLLEGQMRPGGRVRTLREPFSDSLYAEAGAISISDIDHLSLDYARRFGLVLRPTNPSGAPIRFHLRGSWLTDPMRSPYALSDVEREAGLRRMYGRYRELGTTAAAKATAGRLSSPEARELDRLSVAEFLRKEGASAEAIDFLRVTALGFYGDGIDASSALSVFLAESHYEKARAAFAVEGGNDRLPAAFARKLADRIHYGVEVREISQKRDRVRIGGISNGSSISIEADDVVVAIPLTMFKTITWEPALAPGKQRAMTELGYSSVSRVYLQARRRLWEKYHPSARLITDDPRFIVEDHTANQEGPRGIVEGHTFGAEARQVAKLDERERLASAKRHLERLFPGLSDEIEGGVSKCWDEDRWTRGAYVDFRVGQMSAFLDELARPEGRVHFAGEHTSVRFASMEGALQSGVRAAEEIRGRRKGQGS